MELLDDTTHIHHIPTVIERNACGRHTAGKGVGCWDIYLANGRVVPAICNTRAKRAGFTGQISNKALRRTG